MNKVLIAPRKYVQGKDVLKDAGSLISPIGRKVMVLWDAKVKSKFLAMMKIEPYNRLLFRRFTSTVFAGNSWKDSKFKVSVILIFILVRFSFDNFTAAISSPLL